MLWKQTLIYLHIHLMVSMKDNYGQFYTLSIKLNCGYLSEHFDKETLTEYWQQF